MPIYVWTNEREKCLCSAEMGDGLKNHEVMNGLQREQSLHDCAEVFKTSCLLNEKKNIGDISTPLLPLSPSVASQPRRGFSQQINNKQTVSLCLLKSYLLILLYHTGLITVSSDVTGWSMNGIYIWFSVRRNFRPISTAETSPRDQEPLEKHSFTACVLQQESRVLVWFWNQSSTPQKGGKVR